MLICLTVVAMGAAAHTDSISDLAEQKDLTPEKLIRSFAGFTFELSAEPQDAETFLRRKRGDCDDFANLASRILTGRGYRTKLVVVMMKEQTHVVCYVKEARGFLDFNHRADAQPIIESDGSLENIAQKVAGDFRSPWQMVSEVKYENQHLVYLDNAFPGLSEPTAAPATITRAIMAKDEGTKSPSALLTVSASRGSNDLAQVSIVH